MSQPPTYLCGFVLYVIATGDVTDQEDDLTWPRMTYVLPMVILVFSGAHAYLTSSVGLPTIRERL